jgi:hypothetical protein
MPRLRSRIRTGFAGGQFVCMRWGAMVLKGREVREGVTHRIVIVVPEDSADILGDCLVTC